MPWQDVCESAEQPDEIVKEIAANILPSPMPIVRTLVGPMLLRLYCIDSRAYQLRCLYRRTARAKRLNTN